MLYLTLPELELLKEQPTNNHSWRYSNYESFTPSLDNIDSGWLVYATYTTYDSENESNELQYQVFDLYDNREEAIRTATLLYEHERSWLAEPPKYEGVPQYADGREIKNIAFSGWGNRLREVICKRMTVQDHPDTVILS